MFYKFLAVVILVTSVFTATAAPFVVNGSEVTDSATGLIWRRCPEGMAVSSGTCTGIAGTFTHEAALSQAAIQASSTGTAWRLPSVKELSSIADKSRSNPAIDSVVFPNTPASYFWTSSPYVNGSEVVWGVNFISGHVSYGGFRYATPNYVRLVRTGQ